MSQDNVIKLAQLERVPIKWNHLIDKNSLKSKSWSMS